MKTYVDRCQRAQETVFDEGDWVLVKQKRKWKPVTPFAVDPLRVVTCKGDTVKVHRPGHLKCSGPPTRPIAWLKVRGGPEVHFEGPDPEGKRVLGPNLRPTEGRKKNKKQDGGRDLTGVPGGPRSTTATPGSYPALPSVGQELQGDLAVPSGDPEPMNSGAQHFDCARLRTAEHTQHGGRHPREGSSGSRLEAIIPGFPRSSFGSSPLRATDRSLHGNAGGYFWEA
ncbi:hypothetical protein NDU88_005040 [Pleurodeles waltl]|uniref:Uncharacterized protein n=1 Tax=Pleurodeles waltl TaxID=8319 RepID=A0AAV7SKK6_PLEWA|nr:hypothetical protein NDU88_005040 [Pleurodeles waltl]